MILNMPDLTAAEKQNWLLSSVAPRPIALASTISRDGRVNLSRLVFFMCSPASRRFSFFRRRAVFAMHRVSIP